MVIRHSWHRLLGESRYREQFPFTPLIIFAITQAAPVLQNFTLKRLQELLYISTRGRQFQGSLVIIVSEIDIGAEFQQECHLLSTVLPDCCMQRAVTPSACIYFGSWQQIMHNSVNWHLQFYQSAWHGTSNAKNQSNKKKNAIGRWRNHASYSADSNDCKHWPVRSRISEQAGCRCRQLT